MKHSILLSMLLLTGCQWFQTPDPLPPEIQIKTEYIQAPIYHPPLPEGVFFEDMYWYVITEENANSQFEKIRGIQGNSAVVFAVTPQDYENMSSNLQELRRYIRQLLEIVNYYQDAVPGHTPETWNMLNSQSPAQN